MASRVRLSLGVTLLVTGVTLAVTGPLQLGEPGPGAPTSPEAGAVRVTETYTPADPDEQVARPTAGGGRFSHRLVVPRIGLNVRLVDGTDDAALARGVGVWANDTEPGGKGNFVLAGHRVTHGEPFADLPDLRPGDRVAVDTADYRYVYEMDTTGDAYRVDDRDLWPVEPVPTPMRGGSDRILTLITCAETFNTPDRFVAFGHLVGVRLRSEVADGADRADRADERGAAARRARQQAARVERAELASRRAHQRADRAERSARQAEQEARRADRSLELARRTAPRGGS